MMRAACMALVFWASAPLAAAETAPIPVAVSIAPQVWLVRQIAGERVTITTALSPGETPHAFDPTPRHVARLAGARLYFATGVDLENRLLPALRRGSAALRVVDTCAGLPRLTHDHAHHDHHDHAGADPHVWLSPRLMKRQAEHVAAALAAVDPTHADQYRAARRNLVAELDELDADLRHILAPLRGRSFFVLHPAYGYLADAYDLEQVSVEPPGGDPSPRRLAEVLERLKEAGATAVFTQPQVSMSTARAVARGAEVQLVVLDPLHPDVPANLRRMALAIRSALHGD